MLSNDDLTELQRLEESLWVAATRFDRAYMYSVLAPGFVEFGRSGRIHSRDDILDTPARAINARVPLRDFAVHPLSADIVLITYVSRLEGDGLEVANRSSIWVRTDSGWKLRFHQGTPVTKG